MNSKEVEKSL